MSSYLTAELRRLIVSRAEGLCEYCLIHEDDTFFGCEVDHIISEKHGGVTELGNLAFACSFCNRHKGTDLGSIAGPANQLIRFFNPRTDRWAEHFVLNEDGMVIQPRTEIGTVTERIFGFNMDERLQERRALRNVGRYPTPAARKRMLNPV